MHIIIQQTSPRHNCIIVCVCEHVDYRILLTLDETPSNWLPLAKGAHITARYIISTDACIISHYTGCVDSSGAACYTANIDIFLPNYYISYVDTT